MSRTALAVLGVLGLSLHLRHLAADRSILGSVGDASQDISRSELGKSGEWALLRLDASVVD